MLIFIIFIRLSLYLFLLHVLQLFCYLVLILSCNFPPFILLNCLCFPPFCKKNQICILRFTDWDLEARFQPEKGKCSVITQVDLEAHHVINLSPILLTIYVSGQLRPPPSWHHHGSGSNPDWEGRHCQAMENTDWGHSDCQAQEEVFPQFWAVKITRDKVIPQPSVIPHPTLWYQ